MNRDAHKNLWLYGMSLAVSSFGSQFQFLAVTSLTYAITGSPLLTALQMAVNSVPYIFLAPVVGPIVDRHDPRRVDAIGFSAMACLTCLYIFTRNIATMLLLNMVIASVGVFIGAARARLLPQMVGKVNLFRANARLASINGAAMLLAPAIAGMAIMHIGINAAFAINAVSYLFPAMAMFFIVQVEDVSQTTTITRSKEGLRPAFEFLRSQPSHMLLLALFAAYNLGMWAVNALCYPFCKDILVAGPDVLGWTISAYFGAYLLTGMALERRGKQLRNPRLLTVGYAVGAIVWSGYTVTRNIPLILLLSAFDGVVYSFTMTRIDTWVQEEAPEHARGRVGALVRAWEEVAVVSGKVAGGVVGQFSGVINGMRGATLLTLVLVGIGAMAKSPLPAPSAALQRGD